MNYSSVGDKNSTLSEVSVNAEQPGFRTHHSGQVYSIIFSALLQGLLVYSDDRLAHYAPIPEYGRICIGFMDFSCIYDVIFFFFFFLA